MDGDYVQEPGDGSPKLLEYILPSSYAEQVESIELFIQHKKPVLLCGPTGCGKSALLRHVAAKFHRTTVLDLVTIQLCKDVDGRSLLGSYHCTEVGGEFQWVPGVLARAVMNGSWVVLDDLESAPLDVVSVVLPLMQSGTLNIPEIGSTITAGEGFRIFATLGTHDPLIQASQVDPVLISHFKRVFLDKLGADEVLTISRALFPSAPMHNFLPELLKIFNHITSLSDISDVDARRCVAHRLISIRDFLKVCRRISSYLTSNSRAEVEKILLDVCDCLAAFVPQREARLSLAQELGVFLGLTKSDVDYYLLKHPRDVRDSDVRLFGVGRAWCPRLTPQKDSIARNSRTVYSLHPSACRLLESLCMGVSQNETMLLVGETGTGKTTSVQYLAEKLGRTLHVINLSHQAESGDLLGAYKPVEMGRVFADVLGTFLLLFDERMMEDNRQFISKMQEMLLQKNWDVLAKGMRHVVERLHKSKKSRKNPLLTAFDARLAVVEKQLSVAKKSLLFTFLEGTLVTSYRNGDWVLLDEINLATPELLSSLSYFIDSTQTSFLLSDRGDDTPIRRHPEFRLFACMNPATDMGKRDLPAPIRSRFTELYCGDLSDEGEVRQIVLTYLEPLQLQNDPPLNNKIVEMFFKLRNLAESKMVDGVNHKPHYSLRTFTQALKFAVKNPMGKIVRSLYEGFCLSYLTQLNRESQRLMRKTIVEQLFGEVGLNHPDLSLKAPKPTSGRFRLVEGYWIACGQLEPVEDDRYILTETVKSNLTEIARAVSAGQIPVLLQGETSIGKTSMITWLAKATGNRCVRINNHEHTDLQDYMGSYQPNEEGKLVFREGILVDAVRKGYWIILDELNLAPSDVLEALNRLLDANRELFITETQQVVRAHPHFMLFATQNPPGYYGGRKTLSRAFRNRFIEMHFDEIPQAELIKILHKRCDLPESYAKKMVAVMVDLQTLRKSSGIFAGKQGFITLRDLFRWAERYRLASTPSAPAPKGSKGAVQLHDWSQHLADHGYMLLAGRVRRSDEADAIQRVVEKHFNVTIDLQQLFGTPGSVPVSTSSREVVKAFMEQQSGHFGHLAWTSNWQRLVVLAGLALEYGEAVLLVGDTGCGKTTICQLAAEMEKRQCRELLAVNCHMNTETSDFLGGLRPARNPAESGKLFEWQDGPLVAAMTSGAVFLLDEISLADDAVLERLNSVLEPERRLVLPEKGVVERLDVYHVTAAPEFRLVATMNPGGDFGKKELSPALRNRFTEIWCQNLAVPEDVRTVVRHNLWPGGDARVKEVFADAMCRLGVWLLHNNNRLVISTRDVMSWISCMNSFTAAPAADSLCHALDGQAHWAYLHAALTVFHSVEAASGHSERLIGQFIAAQFHSETFREYFAQVKISLPLDVSSGQLIDDDMYFGIAPFVVRKNEMSERCGEMQPYSFDALSVRNNLLRIIRGMSVTKGVLLEGSPGIGKTSLVTALARACGYDVVRINLSEQTDIGELFGADMPVSDETSGALFGWRDGPFLQGLRRGSWILLDELNLASQSVLEGLNACLDHRGAVYIPELGRSFTVDSTKTRIFACQNPLAQGAGRKGLPKSFLNRFTQVYMEALSDEDLLAICCRMYPTIERQQLEKMLALNAAVMKAVQEGKLGQEGRPWEFNLRDVMRWCDLLLQGEADGRTEAYQVALVDLLYAARFRTRHDKLMIWQLAADVVGMLPSSHTVPPRRYLRCSVSASCAQFGVVSLERGSWPVESHVLDLQLLQSQSPLLEKLAFCVNHNLVAILVGASGVGKTAAVQLLAGVCGQRLEVMYLNSALDATELLGGFQQINQQESGSGPTKRGRFEWRDSVVVQAIRDGFWLLLDGANLCSAAVLDRLNSVLEPNGELLLAERGTVGDAVPCIRPHPDFRLFLTMNSKYGELSRAMRNRAIEIFVPADSNHRDQEALLAQLRVPPEDSGPLLRGVHQHMTSEFSLAALKEIVEETMMRRSTAPSLSNALAKAVTSVCPSNRRVHGVPTVTRDDPMLDSLCLPFPVILRTIKDNPLLVNVLCSSNALQYTYRTMVNARIDVLDVLIATCLEIFLTVVPVEEIPLRKQHSLQFLSETAVKDTRWPVVMDVFGMPGDIRGRVSWSLRLPLLQDTGLSMSGVQRDIRDHFTTVVDGMVDKDGPFAVLMWMRSLMQLVSVQCDRSTLAVIWQLFGKAVHFVDDQSSRRLDEELCITENKQRGRLRRCFDVVVPFATEKQFKMILSVLEQRDLVSLQKCFANLYQIEIFSETGFDEFQDLFSLDLGSVFMENVIKRSVADVVRKVAENCQCFPVAAREVVLRNGNGEFVLDFKSIELEIGRTVVGAVFDVDSSEQDGFPCDSSVQMEIVKKLVFGDSGKLSVPLGTFEENLARFARLQSILWRKCNSLNRKVSEEEQIRFLMEYYTDKLKVEANEAWDLWEKVDGVCCDMETNVAVLERNLRAAVTGLGREAGGAAGQWIGLGVVGMKVFVPPLADPVQKIKIKRHCWTQQANECQVSLSAVDAYFTRLYGAPDQENYDPQVSTAYQDHLLLCQEKLAKITALPEVYRPANSIYSAMVQDVVYVRENCLRKGADLAAALVHQDTAARKKALEQLNSWMASVLSVVDDLKRKYFVYRDLLIPFVSALHQFVHGWLMLFRAYRQELFRAEMELSENADQIGHCLSPFSCPDVLSMARTLWNKRAEMLRLLSGNPVEMEVKVIRFVLRLIQIHKMINKNALNDVMNKLVDSVLRRFALIWTDAEEAKKRDTVEKETLYKFADDTLFPNYHSAFGEQNDTVSTEKYWMLTEQIRNEVIQLHCALAGNGLDGDAAGLWRSLIAEGLELRLAVEKGVEVPVDLLGVLLQIRDSVQHGEVASGAFDFYRGENVAECMKCLPLLVDVQRRVNELLMEFEENPILMEISLILTRILQFPVTEPVAKFLTGVELLLAKCQHWESRAHSGVSLQVQLEQLGRLILDWRRLELGQWTRALDTVQKDVQGSANGFWLHLFTVIHQMRFSKEGDKDVVQFVGLLQQMMEKGTLGTFRARLGLMELMERHFDSFGRHNERTRTICAVLRNVRGFYQQFCAALDALLKGRREAIEKELRSFVKIARWSDMNYHSLKASVDKSHAQVMKYMRQFREVLDEPVHLAPAADAVPAFVVLPANGLLGWVKKTGAVDVSRVVIERVDNVAGLMQRSAVLVRRIARQTGLQRFALAVATIGDEAELRWKGMEAATPAGDVAADKRKAALKSLAQQRRLAFTDLRKELSEIGVSWRKGSANRAGSTDAFVSALSGVDLQWAFSGWEVDSQRERCVQLFLRVLAQLAVFQRQAEKPFQGLPVDVVSVMKGMVQHLLALVMQQSRSVAQLAQEMQPVGVFLHSCGCLQSPLQADVTGNDASALRKKARSLVGHVKTGLEQVGLVLDAVPARKETEPVLELLYPVDEDTIKDKSGPQWTDAVQRLKTVSSIVDQHHALIMQQHPGNTLVRTAVYGPNEWQIVTTFLTDVPEIRRHLVALMACVPVCAPGGRVVVEEIDEFCAQCELMGATAQAGTQLPAAMGQLVVACLRGIQTVFKGGETDKDGKDERATIHCVTEQLGRLNTFLDMSRVDRRLSSFVKICNASVWSDGVMEHLSVADVFVGNYLVLAGSVLTDALSLLEASCRLLLKLLDLFGQIVSQGFGNGEVMEEEMDDTAGGKFEETEQAGLGEGEGTKDVSQEIETEDQLEDTRLPGEKEKKEDEEKKTPQEEEHGVEMSEDFDGEMGDVEREAKDDETNDESDEEKNVDKLEQQMGDLGEQDEDTVEQLDEELWGDEQQEEEDEQEKKETDGQGEGQSEKQELIAADEDLSEKEEKGSQDDQQPQPEPQASTQQENDAQAPENDSQELMPEGAEETPEEPGDADDENMEEEVENNPDEKGDAGVEEEQDDVMGIPEVEEKVPELSEEDAMRPPTSGYDAGQAEQEQADVGGEGQADTAADIQKHDDNETAQNEDVDSETAQQGAALDAAGREIGPRGASETPGERKSQQPKRKTTQRPEQRTLGDPAQAARKRLKIVEHSGQDAAEEKVNAEDADMFEHIPSKEERFDQQAVDVGSKEDAVQQKLDRMQLGEEEEEEPLLEGDEDETEDQEDTPMKEAEKMNKKLSGKRKEATGALADETGEAERMETEGEFVETLGADMLYNSFFDVQQELARRALPSQEECERLRAELMQDTSELLTGLESVPTAEQQALAMDLWRKYATLTAGLSYELCEQLRLVLEPTKKSKLRGDYRSGKRLNMRRVMAYVASEFRQDKMWLRRTLPSQRQYQVLVAVDDSASMADNRTKELAFEAVAVISEALSLLQVGELGVCRFGASVQLLHPLQAAFTADSGAQVLSRFTFAQNKTNVPLLLETVCSVFAGARTRLLSVTSVAQLLLIVSDGRGVFQDGDERIERAVRALNTLGVFVVFLILDNPGQGDAGRSITEHVKVTIDTVSQKVEMRNYMQCFPFPFYLVLRNIKQLPSTLADALRQWFELIAAQD